MWKIQKLFCYHSVEKSAFFSLRIYVKSIFKNAKVYEMLFLQFQGLWIFVLDTFLLSQNAKKKKKYKNSGPLNLLKWQFWEPSNTRYWFYRRREWQEFSENFTLCSGIHILRQIDFNFRFLEIGFYMNIFHLLMGNPICHTTHTYVLSPYGNLETQKTANSTFLR